MTYKAYMDILKQQESKLILPKFDMEDAWEIGSILVKHAKEHHMPVIINIRLNNEMTVFQYSADGPNRNNERWLERKFQIVRYLEQSSLYTYMLLKDSGETLKDWHMDDDVYGAFGGGFPIRVKGTGVVGALCASGMDHITEHNIVVDALAEYLGIEDIIRLDDRIK